MVIVFMIPNTFVLTNAYIPLTARKNMKNFAKLIPLIGRNGNKGIKWIFISETAWTITDSVSV